MRIPKRLLRIIGIVVLILLVLYFVVDEPKPEGQQGPKAEKIAQEMLRAVHDSAWSKVGAVAWTYNGKHHYIWDMERNWVYVTWEKNEVWLRLGDKTGVVTVDGRPEEDEKKKKELLFTAWNYWVNDAFWLNPIHKIYDPGTVRRYVKTEEGEDALMITFKKGGNTPGDTYLYVLDPETHLPKYWKIWVSIIPVGGVKFTWSDWKTTASGAKVSELRENWLFDVHLSDVETADAPNDLTGGRDVFDVL